VFRYFDRRICLIETIETIERHKDYETRVRQHRMGLVETITTQNYMLNNHIIWGHYYSLKIINCRLVRLFLDLKLKHLFAARKYDDIISEPLQVTAIWEKIVKRDRESFFCVS